MRTLNPTQEEHLAVKCVENRTLLFGPFDLSTNVTKLNRRNKWEEIAQELLAMGAPIKGATHLRDVSCKHCGVVHVHIHNHYKVHCVGHGHFKRSPGGDLASNQACAEKALKICVPTNTFPQKIKKYITSQKKICEAYKYV